MSVNLTPLRTQPTASTTTSSTGIMTKIGPVPCTAPKRRWRCGTVAKREIKKLAKTTNRLFPKMPFIRILREIGDRRHPSLRWNKDAIDAAHEAAENYITNIFKKADNARKFKGRRTLDIRDMRYSIEMQDLMPCQEPRMEP